MPKQNPHTLIVDDEDNIRFFLQTALESEGHQIAQAASGEEALELLRETSFDLAILDLDLGGKTDGLRVLEAIRWRWPATVVLILTGHGTLESAISAIEEGVEGYLLKPVNAAELRHAVRDAFQRAERRASKAQPSILQHAGLKLDPARHTLQVNGQEIVITPHEFKLMACMLADPQRTFTASELVRAVLQYEPGSPAEAQKVIKWYIHGLRKKIEVVPHQPRHILNVRGVGYRLGP